MSLHQIPSRFRPTPPLELVGHYNPAFEYPAQVVPICRDDKNVLVAVYYRGDALHCQQIPESLDYAQHSARLKESIEGYHPTESGLFAYTKTEVVPFSRAHEAQFLQRLLQPGELPGMNPFVRLAMAHKAGDPAAIVGAVRDCILELGADPEDKFLESWYAQQRELSPALLPPEASSLIRETNRFSVGCLPGDEELLLRLTRAFNDRSSAHDAFAVPIVRDWMPSDEVQRSSHENAFLSMMEDWEPGKNLYPIGGELVLAVNPAFAQRNGIQASSWGEVLRAGLEDEHFQWIRPRNGKAAGDLVDSAVADVFSEAAEAPFAIYRLDQKVERYSPPHEVAMLAMDQDTWSIDAFVTVRHAAVDLLRRLPRDRQPLLLSYDAPLIVPYSIELTDRTPPVSTFISLTPHRAHLHFQEFLRTDAISRAIESYGLLFDRKVAAAADVRLARYRAHRKSMERPVAVSLVVDVSASMRGARLDEAKVAVAAFIGKLDGRRGDAAGLISFSDDVREDVPMGAFADLADTLGTTIAGLRAEGQTALRDALASALGTLEQFKNHIRVVVLLSDGGENASTKVYQRELEALIVERRSIVFCLAYGEDADYEFLRELASLGKGAVLKGSVSNIGELYERVASLL